MPGYKKISDFDSLLNVTGNEFLLVDTGSAYKKVPINSLLSSGLFSSSGYYPPTPYDLSNTNSVITMTALYTKIGNVVTVFGQLTMNPTGSPVEFTLSLPIASNLIFEDGLSGIIKASNHDAVGIISADQNVKRAKVHIVTSWTNLADTFFFNFAYLVQ